jgi:hypothetical protein
MSDAAIFVVVFGGFFILRIIAATLVFLWILPDGNRCPNCDAVTVRVQSAGWNRLMPWFRTSWCHECGWEGLLRETRAEALPPPTPRSPPPRRPGVTRVKGRPR